MKAIIIECRKMGIVERLKKFTLASFVTVWQLETGKKVSIKTYTEGGWWTEDRLAKQLHLGEHGHNPAFQIPTTLKENFGYETVVPDHC